MAECNFSWFKIGSFFGTGLLAILCFMLLGFGMTNMMDGETVYGIACILGGVLSGAFAAMVYKNYQKKEDK